MNNKIIIGVVVAVLVIGGGYWFFGREASLTTSPSTMNQLLASADPLECAYTQNNDQADTTGTLYVADGKVRGDFTIQTKASAGVAAQKLDSHLVTDGKQVLLWPLTSQAPTQGVLINVDPTKKDQVNLDQTFDAVCKPWVKDDAKFAAPTDVQFTDVAVLEKAFSDQAAAAQAEVESAGTTTTAQ